MDQYYTVMYDGVNLYEYNMTDLEREKVEDLRRELFTICDNLSVPRGKCGDGSPYMGRLKDNCDFVIKYSESAGFFALCGERGMFSLMEGFPTKDREQAKYILLKHEFWYGGLMYECDIRNKLEAEWTEKYSVEYDSRKAAFEYEISMLKLVFKRFPDDVIDEHTGHMNKWFDTKHWDYNRQSMLFEETE